MDQFCLNVLKIVAVSSTFHKNKIEIVEPSLILKCEKYMGKLPLLLWNDKFESEYIFGKWLMDLSYVIFVV